MQCSPSDEQGMHRIYNGYICHDSSLCVNVISVNTWMVPPGWSNWRSRGPSEPYGTPSDARSSKHILDARCELVACRNRLVVTICVVLVWYAVSFFFFLFWLHAVHDPLLRMPSTANIPTCHCVETWQINSNFLVQSAIWLRFLKLKIMMAIEVSTFWTCGVSYHWWQSW